MSAVAIVGSGPAGFYTADMLSKARPDLGVDLIERLPFPYGLVRYGVAADHPGTRQVIQLFARVMRRPAVRFLGGVALGTDLMLDELRARYDAVVIATGAAAGRKLAFPGADLPGSVTGYDLARWLNGHPDLGGMALPDRAPAVAIIGNGNVALDIARLLAKTPAELGAADTPAPARAWLAGIGVDAIHIVGRRGPGATRFSPGELSELERLARFAPFVDPEDIDDTEGANPAAAALLQTYATAPERPIRFHFHCRPAAWDGAVLTLADTRGGGQRQLPACLLVHAVGQVAAPLADLPFDPAQGGIANEAGAVTGLDGVFTLGWAARPGDGLIAGNRAHAQALADRVLAWLERAPPRAAGATTDALLASRGVRPVGWEDWLTLDRIETEAGKPGGRPREKLLDRQAVDAVLADAARQP